MGVSMRSAALGAVGPCVPLPGVAAADDAAYAPTGDLKLTEHRGVYATISAVNSNGGIGDGTPERFHDRFGLSSFGRRAVARYDTPDIGRQRRWAYSPALRH